MASLKQSPTFNLKVVLSETGIKAHTVRAWEKKYGLPRPTRSKGKHRLYTQHDIRIVKWLMARLEEGMTIKRAAELWHKIENSDEDPLEYKPHQEGEIKNVFEKGDALGHLRYAWIDACLKFDDKGADKFLTQALSIYPIKMVCLEILQKGIAQIGDLWFKNEVTVQQEHFATAKAIKKLNALLTGAPDPSRLGRLLLACPPGEEHTISLLLLSLLLRYQGWQVVYLGANLPLTQMQATVEAIKPNLVILGAQRLETAATLASVTQLLAKLDVAAGFGGSIFNRVPSLRDAIAGHFLGETIEDAIRVVDRIITFDPPMRQAEPLPQAYQAALRQYGAAQGLIDFDIRQILEKENIPYAHLDDANHRFKDSLTAALSLGNIALMNSELQMFRQLMNNYGVPDQAQAQYLRAQHIASEKRLRSDGQIILEWFKSLESSEYLT